jgi:hypothetical protein
LRPSDVGGYPESDLDLDVDADFELADFELADF